LEELAVKISVAASAIGVSQKTIYNWLEDGSLKLYHPGFVLLSEARRVWLEKNNTKSETSKRLSGLFARDLKGRFITLKDGLN
jgi:hypothetical protein